MKKLFALLITIMILLAACQPTPEEEIVVNKNDGKFEQELQATPTETPVLQETQHVEAKIKYPENWQAYYEKYDGRLKMTIDAEVIVSDAEKYPIAEIKPYYIPIEQANKMIEAIYGTLDIYCVIYERTKEDIQNMIVQVKADINKAENDGDEEAAEQYRETLNSMVESLKDAPDVAEPQKYSGEYDIYQGEDSEQWSISVRENPLDVHTPYLGIHNIVRSKIGNGYNASVSYGNFSEDQHVFIDESILKTKYSENPIFDTDKAKKAVEIANSFLTEIGIEDRVVEYMLALPESESQDEIIGYKIFYGKKFNGIIIPRNVQFGGSWYGNSIQTEENYIAQFTYEWLEMDVTDGEISGIEWNSPFDIKQIVKDDIELMPFEEIMSKAENQLSVKYAYIENGEESRAMYIDEIILTYAVEPIKDKKYEYMLIPVWAFYGGVDYGEGTEVYGGEIREGRYPSQESLLTINAVDGSVIFGR